MQRSNIEEEVVKIFVWNWKSGDVGDFGNVKEMKQMVVNVQHVWLNLTTSYIGFLIVDLENLRKEYCTVK